MATYNRAHLIMETIISIQNQTHTNFECLIIDDGGSDSTETTLAPVLKTDNRFRYLKRPETYLKGLPGSRNFGLDIGKGRYVIFFDDDDIVHPQNLELCVNELDGRNVDCCRYIRDVFHGEFGYNFDFSKKYKSFYFNREYIEQIVKNEFQINSCAIMWKASCIQSYRFVEQLQYAEEWELYSRIIMSVGFVGVSIDKTLFYGRKHDNSNTGKFYNKNKLQISSNAVAIYEVCKNLKANNLLTKSIFRHFVQISLSYRQYKLFDRLRSIKCDNFLAYIMWSFIYKVLPIKLSLHQAFKKK